MALHVHLHDSCMLKQLARNIPLMVTLLLCCIVEPIQTSLETSHEGQEE
jgi:hypothetical protein